MAKLICDERTVRFVNYNDVENLILSVYGKPYEIPPGEELGSGQHTSYFRYVVASKEILDFERANVEHFSETGEGSFILRTLLNDMCVAGHIEPGEYFLQVGW